MYNQLFTYNKDSNMPRCFVVIKEGFLQNNQLFKMVTEGLCCKTIADYLSEQMLNHFTAGSHGDCM